MNPHPEDARRSVLTATYEAAEKHERWESIYRGHALQDRLNDRIMDRIMAHLRPPANAYFLDAGCGVGDHSIRIAKRGYRCMGLDISHSILKQAAVNVTKQGLTDRITVSSQALENLGLPDNTFDCVHCRGVLMHIPEWEKGLAHLCRVLKPGGRIAILEANDASTDAAFVRLARAVMKRRSKMIRTAAGLEFWSEDNGVPFVVRMAKVSFLVRKLQELGVRTIARFATEFLDLGRFPSHRLKNAAVAVNRFWFSLHLPAIPSAGNAIVGEKL